MDEHVINSIASPALPPSIVRGLGDRSYDKRKNAALEITSLIKSLQESGDRERIAKVLVLLAQDFCKSRNSNHRKGGLIGLAAAAIGLMEEIGLYLHYLVTPVLECFDDQEARVCYYACEAMYNITKVAKTAILKYFNQIFEGLCTLFAHVDSEVKNGVNLLDKLVKDIVVQADTFDIESFIPVLQKHIKKTKPYIRQLLVSWIAVLDTVPDIAMLDYLPEFLEGLFNMLSDPNKEIRQSADNTLQEFLNEIKQAEVVEFGPMVGILVNQCISREKFNRLRALQWIQLFIVLGGARLRLFYAELLGSILYCISDTEADISTAAKETNDALRNLVRSTTEKFEWMPVLSRLTTELISTHVITRVSALYWIKMLHEKDSYQMNQSISNLLPVLLKILSDDSDEVLVINLHVLARIAHDEIQFLRVLQALNQLFVNDRSLLETRGALIIRKLCALLDCKDIFITLANILNDKNDLEYVSLMVQTLNLILLTAPELAPLRKLLKECSQNNDANMEKEKDAKAIEITATNSSTNTANSGVDTNRLIDSYSTASYTNIDSKQVFIILYKCWCHNPVATLSLCLLAEYYELSSLLIFKFVDVDISVSFLMQIDKLIQLIESPIFLQLRLQLLDNHTKHHAELLKTLYGLLMILPQSVAYKTLSDRLATVSSLQMHLGFSQQVPLSKDERKKNMSFVQMDYTDCIARFEYIQQKHSTFKLALIQQKSLLYETDNVETAQPADGMASK